MGLVGAAFAALAAALVIYGFMEPLSLGILSPGIPVLVVLAGIILFAFIRIPFYLRYGESLKGTIKEFVYGNIQDLDELRDHLKREVFPRDRRALFFWKKPPEISVAEAETRP